MEVGSSPLSDAYAFMHGNPDVQSMLHQRFLVAVRIANHLYLINRHLISAP